MRFEWDENKNASNLLKHRVAFETAILAFDDPDIVTQLDPFEDEERWRTMARIESGAVLVIIHTCAEQAGEETVRIISARLAESRERRIYEEANQGTKKRHSRARSNARRRH
jgi:hypothetical protein